VTAFSFMAFSTPVNSDFGRMYIAPLEPPQGTAIPVASQPVLR
jgi:hypothetical protein